MVKYKCKIISIQSCRFPGTQKYVLPNVEFSRSPAVNRLGYQALFRERSLGARPNSRERRRKLYSCSQLVQKMRNENYHAKKTLPVEQGLSRLFRQSWPCQTEYTGHWKGKIKYRLRPAIQPKRGTEIWQYLGTTSQLANHKNFAKNLYSVSIFFILSHPCSLMFYYLFGVFLSG